MKNLKIENNKQNNKQSNKEDNIKITNKMSENQQQYNNKIINNIYIHYNTLHYNNLFLNIVRNADFEDGLSHDERDMLKRLVKKLEINLQEQHLQYLSNEKILEYKVMYWVLKEFSTSAYKIYTNDIDRKTFYLKFLLTKHYKQLEDNEESIKDFISYFIKTLRNEFEKGE